ncbi:MAG: hypothetical protein JWQ48_2325, partial [Conexibacter sp.]|nr:hypothetical protein [Conexibacter sp.]
MTEAEELRRRARVATEALRPHPHRGDLIGAGAIPFTLGVVLVNVRLDSSWGTGIFFVLTALACALVLGMGVLAPLEGERPRAYQQVLLLGGLVLLFVTLLRLAQVLGSDAPLNAQGSTFWIATLLASSATWLARERRSAICALVAAVAGGVALLAFVGWVFHPHGPGSTRWILFLVAIGLVFGALVLRDRRRRESVYLIDAAGLAMLVLGLTYVGSLFSLTFAADAGSVGPGAGWKLILLAAGLGLVAYAGVDEEPGPAYIGALNLLLFLVLDGIPGRDGASLWFWPVVLLLAGGAMIAAGLRPRVPLPPEPPPVDGPGETVPGPFPPSPAPGSAPGAGATGATGAPFARPARPLGPEQETPPGAPEGEDGSEFVVEPPPAAGQPPAPGGPPVAVEP